MILVTGATGFVGSHVARALCDRGEDVRALVRPGSRTARLEHLGCEVFPGDVTDEASVRAAAEGCSAVVHLVSIIAGRPDDFERVMTRGTEKVVRAAESAGAGRIVLISALGLNERSRDAVPYYRAKWAMEQSVARSSVEHVVLRPGFVFGADGGVLPQFLLQVRLMPIVPVPGSGQRRLQPIWIDDLAAFVATAVSLPAVAGRTFELAGPDVVTWDELFARLASALGKRRTRVRVPLALARAGAALAERLPKPPVTRDQLTMLELGDNVCDPRPANETFGIEPIGLDEMLCRATAAR